MKLQKSIRGLGIAGLVSLLGGMLVVFIVWLRDEPPLARKLDPKIISTNEPSTASRSTSMLPVAMTISTPPRGNGEKPKTTLDEWREEVFEQHADIAHFAKLNRRILKSGDDRSSFQQMLADREIILQSKQELLDDATAYSDVEQRKRMYRVEYLGAAIQWRDNPERALAIEAIEDVIFARNIKFDTAEEQKHSLAGDKVELYWALLEHDPAQAQIIAEKAQGTEFEHLVEYAQKRWDAIMNADNGGD